MRLINNPVLCNYYVTYRCNAKCGFCNIWQKSSHYVTVKNFYENLKDMKRLGVKIIDLTGGEPLLHKQIDELLFIAKQTGFITTITTNCLLYPKLAELLRKNVDMLHFSLDSSVKEQHDHLRGVSCYDFVLKSIETAKSLGEKPDILFTVFDHNIGEIKKVYENICLPNNLVLILNPVFEYNGLKTRNKLSEAQLNLLSEYGKKKNIYLNQAFILLRKDGGNHINKPVCRSGSSTIVISPENKLVLPCYHLGMQEYDINGNLFELYNSQKIKEKIALEGRYPECEGCVINCYMQPSFAVNMNKYWWKALPGMIKYNRMKGTWKALIRKKQAVDPISLSSGSNSRR